MADTLRQAADRAAFEAGRPLTLFVKGGIQGRSQHWQFCTLRLRNGMVETAAPGYARWSVLTETAPLNAAPHAFASWLLATRALLPYLTGEDTLTGGMVLAPAAWCARCGRMLTHPDSLASGYGPECDGRADARRQRREAKRAAAANFMQAMRERAGL